MKPEIILINPWIYDFAAYDLWAKPLGLLYLASRLRTIGFAVHLIDCLDVHNPLMEKAGYRKKPVRRLYGAGKYWKQVVPKPPQLSGVSRAYSRYGISSQIFERELKKVKQPKAILVTSLMTYWYPGVFEAIRIAKKIYPNTPVILGGIYAALCAEHAKTYSDADLIISSSTKLWPPELSLFLKSISDFTVDEKIEPFYPYPAFDMLTKLDYICLLSSYGCPFGCPYCASGYLSPLSRKREPLELFEEVLFWHKNHKVIDFAFYDDALLVDASNHICIFLEKIVKNGLKLRFHCPNGLHVSCIDKDLAALLFRAGFSTIRLGLETSDAKLQKDLGGKFREGEFERAVNNLKKAGFASCQIGAYILMGLPRQTISQVADTINFAGKAGAMPYLSEYSPIPHTEMWKDAVKISRFDLESEPLLHNNSILPCWDENFLGEARSLKNMALDVRRKLN